MSFDGLAPYYRIMETLLVGTVLQRCRARFLPQTRHCRRALLLGEGPGRFLVELLTSNARIEVVCVEQSPRMIEESKRALRQSRIGSSRVQFVQMDALKGLPPGGPYDLVATHFFLDCFRPEEIERLILVVADNVLEGTIWLNSDFQIPKQGWPRYRAVLLLKLMYSFFRRMTGIPASSITDPHELLLQAGFRLSDEQLDNFGFVHAGLWVFAGTESGTSPASMTGDSSFSPFTR